MVGAQHPGREGTWGQRESGRAFEDRGHLRTEGEEPGREGWGGARHVGKAPQQEGGLAFSPVSALRERGWPQRPQATPDAAVLAQWTWQ